jgi:hypothetical protein
VQRCVVLMWTGDVEGHCASMDLVAKTIPCPERNEPVASRYTDFNISSQRNLV